MACSVEVEGFGYWSGRDVKVRFRSAPANTGIVFVRSDLPTNNRIPAIVENRIEIPRRTTLVADGARVEMVEHIMAALAGLHIDNCEVWVDGIEMPGLDGSAQAFVDALESAGIVEQNAVRPHLVIDEITRVGNDECWVEARPVRGKSLSIRYKLDYGPDSAIGRQTLDLKVTPESFRKELASARTFILRSEADWLLKQGLGSRVTVDDLLVFDDNGPCNNPLRFEDECVRHKTLDLVGDLALAGCDLVGQIIAYRSGHRLNAELVKALLSENQVSGGLRKTA
ncbi:MAG TPA: UDP-3-O-acyl-N-acetylglucosamine deacetylase [Pirellulaceae bacterium]|nr:UDP-3-O-acyl-N-acetylglucosamine deacetylase [Pirellulaceae bacterium]